MPRRQNVGFWIVVVFCIDFFLGDDLYYLIIRFSYQEDKMNKFNKSIQQVIQFALYHARLQIGSLA